MKHIIKCITHASHYQEETMNISDKIQLALEHHQSGNLLQAEKIYREILMEEQTNFYALQYLGILCYQLRNYDSATQYIRKALELNPTADDALYNLGNVYKDSGRLNEAIDCFRKSLELDPQNADAFNNLGMIYKDKGQINDATASFKKAIQLNPNHVIAYYNLGVIYKDKKQFDDAISCYEKVLELNPNIMAAYYNLGMIYHEKEQFDEAITNYQKAIQLNPDMAELYSNLGTALQKRGRLNEAITNYQKAIQLNPDMAEPYCNLGNAFQEQGRRDEAIANYQKAIQLNPSDPSAYYGISQISQLAGQRLAPEQSSLYKEWAPHRMEFLVDNENKVFYLSIRKVASSSIKHELFFKPLFGNYDYSKIVYEINYILGYSYTTTLEPYKDFFKFAVIRNPYTRFMSSYFMGIHKQRRWEYNLLENLGIEDWPEEILNDPNKFINSIDKEILNRDPHTALQTYLLPADLNKLDYVGKVENLEEVAQRLSEVLCRKIKFLPVQKGRDIDYSSLEIDVDRFNQIFAEDYETLKDFYSPLKK
jgi:tetratricopeptide (TPR) repeat protein